LPNVIKIDLIILTYTVSQLVCFLDTVYISVVNITVTSLTQCLCDAGPVFVEFPIDTLYPYKLVEHEAGLGAGKTLGQRLVNMCVDISELL